MKLIKAKKYLCMLLAAMLVSAAAIGVNAEELITGIGDWLVDIGISEDPIDDYPVEDELVPQAATACEESGEANDAFDWTGHHANIHLSISGYENRPIHGVFYKSAYNAVFSFKPSGAYKTVDRNNVILYYYHYPNAGIEYRSNVLQDGICETIIVQKNKSSGRAITAYPTLSE